MEITIPPFEDIDENGNYIGNEINFLIKNDIDKDKMLSELLTDDFFDLISGTPIKRLKTQLYVLNKCEWDEFCKLILKNNYIKISENKDTIIINNLIFKKSN
jgi:hypothetical protein